METIMGTGIENEIRMKLLNNSNTLVGTSISSKEFERIIGRDGNRNDDNDRDIEVIGSLIFWYHDKYHDKYFYVRTVASNEKELENNVFNNLSGVGIISQNQLERIIGEDITTYKVLIGSLVLHRQYFNRTYYILSYETKKKLGVFK